MENRLLIDANGKQNELNDLFGIFFEDLNHAADGGLYAELIQNRSFEFDKIDNPDYHAMTAWECVENSGKAAFHIETSNPVSARNPHYLVIDIKQPGKDVGVLNTGFNTGIPLKKGETYYFTCFAKRTEGSAGGFLTKQGWKGLYLRLLPCGGGLDENRAYPGIPRRG